jgi:hypothetical protein
MNLDMADARVYAGKMLSQASVKGARAVLESWKKG